jgi:UDP:flavonoid glycosyltransferase YjiC (YdhE family)
LPKPKDWGSHISVSGFLFLPPGNCYTPPPNLVEFLEAGDPPVYIGFGSIVVDNPDAMTSMVFEAVKQAGVRAVVSKGWGGLGNTNLELPKHIFLLGNIPHTWLFE